MEESPGTGRSRGRARGRAQQTPQMTIEQTLQSMQAMRISPEPGSGGNGDGNGSSGNGNGGPSNGSNGNGDNGEGPALRGRGGYRGRADDLNTVPEGVTEFKGKAGQEVTLFANYFRLKTPTNAVVQSYRVDFTPEIEAVALRRKMLYSIENLFSKSFIFDGQYDIKSVKRLKDNAKEEIFTVKHPTDQSNVEVKVRHTGEVPWGSSEMMRMYNIQMRKNLRYIGYCLMGRNYFDPNAKETIEMHNIELWPGVITAIGPHESDILMVVDSSTKFVRAETVLQLLEQIRRREGSSWLDTAKKEICGMIVMTKYNNRTYKVDDIVTDKNPMTATFVKNDREMNLIDYYRQSYDINIRATTQPLIEVLPSLRDRRAGNLQKLLLIPELCSMTGLTEQMRNDFNLMRKIADVSRLKPNDRTNNLMKFIRKVVSNEKVQKDMTEWGLSFDTSLVQLAGRQLPCERVYMGNDSDMSAAAFDQKSGDFSKAIRSKRLYTACSITRWMIICAPKDRGLVEDFMNTLKRVCGPMGINLGQPRQQMLSDDRTSSFVSACQALSAPCEMVVVIVPNNNKDRYDAIKKICYCENPMPSQVIVARTLVKKQMLMSVCTKIGIQMACKIGGEPWALKIPPKEIMVVGYDTYHDTSARGRSVGGFVCSMNATLTSWYSRVSYHTNQEEMSSNFGHNLIEGIKRYFEVNKSFPKRVFVYRDGVGDGQIPHVFDHELRQILSALSKVKNENPPQLSFTIVTKRVNARFFTMMAQNYDNPIPGTVVDSVVTKNTRYDFYLISQSVRQGTVTPTMYNIIYDKSTFKPEHHQQFAYKLTHLYFNWPGTIRVPAPCQYAHKLAYMVGTSLHREPSLHMCDRLFYL